MKMKKTILRYLDYVIYWTIILIPFFLAIAPAPVSVFMGFMIAAFLTKKILKKEPIFPRTAINWPLLFLLIITCISLVHSINYRDSFKGGIGRLVHFGFVFLILSSEIRNKKHLFKIIFSICLGLFIASIDSLWQVTTGRDFIRGYPAIVNIGLVRATGSFKDSNLLGIYLSGFTPLVIGLALFYYKNKKQIPFIIIGIFALAGIILTYSRPTLLAIYLVLVFFALVKKDKILISFLIIFTLLSPFLLPKAVSNWAREVEYNPLRFMCNDDRIAAYRNSMNMIKAHPFIGVGANTYMKNYKQYKENPEYRNVVTQDTMYAHNMYLQMAAELGIIGFSIFIWLLFKLFSASRRIFKALKDNYLKILTISLTACLIAFLVNGLTESSLYYSRVAIIFWYLSGLLLSLKKFT